MVTEYPRFPATTMPPLPGAGRRGRTSPAVLAALALLLAATPAAAQPAAPATAAAEAGAWTPERTAFGRVMPSRDATLSLPFAATVTQLAVEPGQQVEDGQVLARLEAPPLAVLVGKLQVARRAADLTEQRLAGLQQREKASLATKDDVLQGEIAANEARSALDEAWQALAETLVALGQKPDRAAITDRPGNAADALARGLAEVRAPFAGTVAAVPASAGATLAGGPPWSGCEDLPRPSSRSAFPPRRSTSGGKARPRPRPRRDRSRSGPTAPGRASTPAPASGCSATWPRVRRAACATASG